MKKYTRQDKKLFTRSFSFSCIIFGAIVLLILGVSKSYEAIRRVGYCESDRQSVSISPNGEITILDFTI